jgi:hypothetical protein
MLVRAQAWAERVALYRGSKYHVFSLPQEIRLLLWKGRAGAQTSARSTLWQNRFM